MTTVTIHKAKTNLSKLIEETLEGGEVIIAKGNLPVARLVPYDAPPKRLFGALKDKISIDDAFFEPLPDDALTGWNDPA